MKPLSLILKYYAFLTLITVLNILWILGSDSPLPFILTLLFAIILIWGLIYSHLKESNLQHSQKEFLIIYFSTLPPALLSVVAIINSLGNFGGPIFLALSVLCLGIHFAFLKGIFSISKSMIINTPTDDDYND